MVRGSVLDHASAFLRYKRRGLRIGLYG
jgi:hypothetical protein